MWLTFFVCLHETNHSSPDRAIRDNISYMSDLEGLYDNAAALLNMSGFHVESFKPAHEEFFTKAQSEKFDSNPYVSYTSKLQKKVGGKFLGQKIGFEWDSRFIDDGDVCVQLAATTLTSLLNEMGGQQGNSFSIKIIYRGQLLSQTSFMTLETAVAIALMEDFEMAIGISNGANEIDDDTDNELSPEDAKEFQKILRANLEAFLGVGLWKNELEEVANSLSDNAKNGNSGCMGLLLIPVAIAGVLSLLL